MNLGLKRGTVDLVPHQNNWAIVAKDTILKLRELLLVIAIDIQHIGSTSISSIVAKPIIDLAVGVNAISDVEPYINILDKNKIIYRGSDVYGQLLFIIGDLDNDIVTHHIHIVEYGSIAWNNYIKFRDYLSSNPDKALEYELLKRQLATDFPDNRDAYTKGKQDFIESMLTKII